MPAPSTDPDPDSTSDVTGAWHQRLVRLCPGISLHDCGSDFEEYEVKYHGERIGVVGRERGGGIAALPHSMPTIKGRDRWGCKSWLIAVRHLLSLLEPNAEDLT